MSKLVKIDHKILNRFDEKMTRKRLVGKEQIIQGDQKSWSSLLVIGGDQIYFYVVSFEKCFKLTFHFIIQVNNIDCPCTVILFLKIEENEIKRIF